MGDLLTSVTVWLALVLYAASQLWRRHIQTRNHRAGLWLLGLGLACYVAHIVMAFDTHYRWSHAVAYAETAAQTEALLGWASGNGLYVNYLFGFAWLAEVCWWAKLPKGYLQRSAWMELTVRSVFLFMIINGAVIFVDLPQRWLGATLVLALLIAWRPARRRRN